MMLGVHKDCFSILIGPTGYYWRFLWLFIAPVFLMGIAVLSLIYYSPSAYGEYKFPLIPELIGWAISFSSIIWIPIFAVYKIIQFSLNGEPFSSLFKASIEWCPASERAKRKKEAEMKEMQPYMVNHNGTSLQQNPHQLNAVVPYYNGYGGGGHPMQMHPMSSYQYPHDLQGQQYATFNPQQMYAHPYYGGQQGYYATLPHSRSGGGGYGGYVPAAYFTPYRTGTAERRMKVGW